MLISRLFTILGGIASIVVGFALGLYLIFNGVTAATFISGFVVVIVLVGIGMVAFSIAGNVSTKSVFDGSFGIIAEYRLLAARTKDRWINNSYNVMRDGSFFITCEDTYRVYVQDDEGRICPKELPISDTAIYTTKKTPRLVVHKGRYHRVRKFYFETKSFGYYYKDYNVLYIPENAIVDYDFN